MTKDEIREYVNPSDWVKDGKVIVTTSRMRDPEACCICGEPRVAINELSYLRAGLCEKHKNGYLSISDGGVYMNIGTEFFKI